MYIQYQTLLRRINHITCSPYIPVLEKIVKACLIVRMMFLPMNYRYINNLLTWDIWSGAIVKDCLIMQMIFLLMTEGYINMYLTRDIRSGAIYNLQFTPIKWRYNIPAHNVKYHDQCMQVYDYNFCVTQRIIACT